MIEKHSNAPAAAQLLKAIAFAAHKHKDQRRKDHEASPYINHPIAVATLLAVEGGVDDLVTLQAAILHDTIEDTETTYDELASLFGREVADVVLEVTDDKSIKDKAVRKQLQLEHAPGKSVSAAMVKLADKTCNLRDIGAEPPKDWDAQRKQDYLDWARRVVEALPRVHEGLLERFSEAYGRGFSS